MTNEAMARVASIARGLVALLEMQTDKPAAVKFAEALSIRQDDGVVKGRLSLPAEDVLQVIWVRAGKKVAIR